MLKIYYQKPKNYIQKLFLSNLSVFLDIEIIYDFDTIQKNNIYIISDKAELGYRSNNLIQSGHPIYIDNIPKLSTIGLYKNGTYKKEYECNYLYISDFPIMPREYIIDELSNKVFAGLRIVGSYPINLPNYIGMSTYNDAMTFAKSAKQCLDFDNDLYYEYVLNDCNIFQNNKKVSKDEIINELNYIQYFMLEIKRIDSELFNKCEEFLNETTRNLC